MDPTSVHEEPFIEVLIFAPAPLPENHKPSLPVKPAISIPSKVTTLFNFIAISPGVFEHIPIFI